MKCPNCGMELEKGFLQGNERLAWVKKPHKFSLHPKQGEIMIENNVMKSVVVDGGICKKCKLIIVDYSDKVYIEGL